MQRRSLLQAFAAAMLVQWPAVRAQQLPSAAEAGWRSTLEALADALIPRTATPGAADTGVVAWITGTAWPRMLRASEREVLAAGLAALDAASREAEGVPFAALPLPRRTQVLATIDAMALDPTPPRGDDAALQRAMRGFWYTAKRLVIAGHYTSQAGCRAELDYRAVPGPFVGDLPMTPATRSFYQDWIGVPFFPAAPPGNTPV